MTHTVRIGKRFLRLYFGDGLIAKAAALWIEFQNREQARSLREEEEWWRRLRKVDRRSGRLLEHLGRFPEPGGSPETNAKPTNVSEVA